MGISPCRPDSVVLPVGGLRVGVIGLTEPQMMVAKREGIGYLEVIPAARREVTRLKGTVDLLIALSNLPADLNEDLRTQVRELDLIVTGPPAAGAPLVSGVHAPWTVRIQGLGRALGRLDLWLTPGVARSLVRSAKMEKHLVSLEAARYGLKKLSEQIVLEEGKPNEKRLATQGAWLRSQIDTLSRELELMAAGERVFTFRELPLSDEIPEDPAISARIKQYHLATGREPAPAVDSPRF